VSQIAHIANLWSLARHPSVEREWSLEKKIKAVADAGFDGITTILTPEHRRLADKHGLEHALGFVSSSNPEEFADKIRSQKEGGAVQINVQLDDHDTPPALAAKHWIRFVREAEKIGGVVVSLEVHRDVCTETPEKTYEIAERYYKATGELIRINFDFSHFAVVKHLAPDNYIPRMLDHPELIQNSEQWHLRPFNGHHCQVPVMIKGKLTPEVKACLVFAKAFLKIWRSGKVNQDKTLFVCPEMGPYNVDGGGYNISGLPPAWPDAVVLRGEIAKVWQAAS
jgi:hypothetical protein